MIVQFMRVFLELLRIIVIFILLGGIFGAFMRMIYSMLGVYYGSGSCEIIMGIAIFILIFVLYRNRFQFSGWYKEKGMNKLSRSQTVFLLFCSLLLLMIAPLTN